MNKLIELFEEFNLRFFQGFEVLKHKIKDAYHLLIGEDIEE